MPALRLSAEPTADEWEEHKPSNARYDGGDDDGDGDGGFDGGLDNDGVVSSCGVVVNIDNAVVAASAIVVAVAFTVDDDIDEEDKEEDNEGDELEKDINDEDEDGEDDEANGKLLSLCDIIKFKKDGFNNG